MDRFIALNLLAWLLIGANVASAQQQFPYVAYVTGEQAYVRSGPGQRYYPTGQIAEGYAVEVYRHDDDGWCAIRPPENSFSWVPSHQVLPVGNHVVEVLADQVVAHVGSSLSPDRSAVQVLLPKGERIELLTGAESDDPRWVRITAPAGEFRWIAAAQLSLQPPLETKPISQAPVSQAPIPQTTESGWTQQSERSTSANSEPNAFDHLNEKASKGQTGLQFETPIKAPTQATTPPAQADSHAIEIVAGSPAELQLAQFQSQPPALAPPALLTNENAAATEQALSRSSQPRVRFDGPQVVLPVPTNSVEELELKLSQAVVESPQQWQLAPLEAEANRLLQATKTPAVRAQLREFIERITRFQQVQQRYTNPPPVIVATQREPTPAAAPFETATTESPGLTGMVSTIRERVQADFAGKPDASLNRQTSSADKPLYDAAGFLKPVVSKRENAPPYALVDEQGKVVSFVTPTPDLNLKPYVGQRIGVHGTRGFMPEYRRAHVTTGRITPIDDTLRR